MIRLPFATRTHVVASSIAMLVLTAFGCGRAPEATRRSGHTTALPDGTALTTWEDSSGAKWIARLDSSAKVKWKTALQGAAQDVWSHGGLVIARDVVGVRTLARRGGTALARLEAIELATGKRVWASPLGELSPAAAELALDRNWAGYATGDAIHAFTAGAPGSLVELDARTGARRATSPLAIAPQSPLPHADGIIVHDGRVRAIAVGPRRAELASAGVGCVVGDVYWRLVETAREFALVANEAAATTIPLEIAAGENPTLEGCAAYGDQLVVFLAGTGAPGTELRVLARDGSVRQRIEVGELSDRSGLRDTHPHLTHATGTLSRYLPLLAKHEDVRNRLLMVDLEAGRIAWDVPLGAGRPSADLVFRVDGRWYLRRLADEGWVLARFDDATGKLAHAVVVQAPDLDDLDPVAVAGGTVWVSASNAVISKSFARLDAATLAKAAGAEPFRVTDAKTHPLLAGIPQQ